MEKSEFVQGLVSAETKRRFNHHPGYYGKTQREFVGEIVENWLESPAARLALLEKCVDDLARKLDEACRELDEVRKEHSSRIAELEARVEAPGRPPSVAPFSAELASGGSEIEESVA